VNPESETTVVHSSDLHLAGGIDLEDLSALKSVLSVAERLHADLVLLAGDVFDNNRVPPPIIDLVTELLAGQSSQVVILPGNHDCLVEDSVYRRGRLADVANVHIFGLTVEEGPLNFNESDIEIWGRPHMDYSDMVPLNLDKARSLRWQIAMAHGHWFQSKQDAHRSYLIRDEHLETCSADYIALGHWDRALQIGDGNVPAYYSGSPQLAKTVNAVRFGPGGVRVSREPLDESQAT
jgi:DNA repair exonuclease SbcCD nuclease subunit